jgi:hypothetical protein
MAEKGGDNMVKADGNRTARVIEALKFKMNDSAASDAEKYASRAKLFEMTQDPIYNSSAAESAQVYNKFHEGKFMVNFNATENKLSSDKQWKYMNSILAYYGMLVRPDRPTFSEASSFLDSMSDKYQTDIAKDKHEEFLRSMRAAGFDDEAEYTDSIFEKIMQDLFRTDDLPW